MNTPKAYAGHLPLFGLLLLLSALCSTVSALSPPVSLASYEWRYQLDRNDEGTSQSWWKRNLPGKIRLPGSLTENRVGDEITSATPWVQKQGALLDEWNASTKAIPYLKPGRVKVPFWLNPLKYYMGAAWYQRDITIPPDWDGRQCELYLERTHWRTDVWIDDKACGFRDSLSVPHQYNLGTLSPGKHRITIRVDNRLIQPVGNNAHSVSDHTQTNWNGIIGKMEVRPLADVSISDAQAYPNLQDATVRVNTTINNASDSTATGRLSMVLYTKGGALRHSEYSSTTFTVGSKKQVVPTTLALNQPMQLWSEFDPNLYEVRIDGIVTTGDTTASLPSRKITFGFRDFATSGTQFVLNGNPIFLRGTLECCIFPLTGYPPTDVGSWRRIINICRDHGLNHIRFHSWCPPEAAFQAADEEGFYLSIECASWSWPGVDPVYDKWLYAESRRIVAEYGNHPSFCMMLYGNEPGGPKRVNFLAGFVNYWKKRDPRRLYSSGAGWPSIAANQFHVTPHPRIQRMNSGLTSRINALPPATVADYRDFVTSYSVPVISHEIGQWCVYPNLEERSKYTGVTRAYNFDIFAESLTKNSMADQARDFLLASGKLQVLCYKEEIESALRTPGMGGYQLLDLHDFPGQGTALVGVLDPFWDSKGYVTAAEYRSFSGPVVPLARLSRRVFTSDETLTASVEVANFGRSPIPNAESSWTITDGEGRVAASGKFPRQTLPLGNGIQLGEIRQKLTLTSAGAPQKLTLEVSIAGTDARNSWDIWVYPPTISTTPPADVLITSDFDATAMSRLSEGGKVLLLARPTAVLGDTSGRVEAGFSSIFWNTAWTLRQAPTTLGILCDPSHPAMASFPTEFHTNWQWWYLIHNSPVMIMDPLKPSLRPIVQMIDDWVTNRRLGYIFEGRYGKGKLMVCSFNLLDPAKAKAPVARQLLHSLLRYMGSDQFSPQQEVTRAQLQKILKLP